MPSGPQNVLPARRVGRKKFSRQKSFSCGPPPIGHKWWPVPTSSSSTDLCQVTHWYLPEQTSPLTSPAGGGVIVVISRDSSYSSEIASKGHNFYNTVNKASISVREVTLFTAGGGSSTIGFCGANKGGINFNHSERGGCRDISRLFVF